MCYRNHVTHESCSGRLLRSDAQQLLRYSYLLSQSNSGNQLRFLQKSTRCVRLNAFTSIEVGPHIVFVSPQPKSNLHNSIAILCALYILSHR